MTTFLDAVQKARVAFREAGYPSAVLELHISREDIDAVQRDPDVIRAVIEQALRPSSVVPPRVGMRLFAILHDVRVYVEA